MTERINMRQKLECKSFKWYLQNIYPESHIPIDYKSLGRVRISSLRGLYCAV